MCRVKSWIQRKTPWHFSLQLENQKRIRKPNHFSLRMIWFFDLSISICLICWFRLHIVLICYYCCSRVLFVRWFVVMLCIQIHIGPTKFKWDPHALVGPMWILTNQRECVEKCVLECVLLAFLFKLLFLGAIMLLRNWLVQLKVHWYSSFFMLQLSLLFLCYYSQALKF